MYETVCVKTIIGEGKTKQEAVENLKRKMISIGRNITTDFYEHSMDNVEFTKIPDKEIE